MLLGLIVSHWIDSVLGVLGSSTRDGFLGRQKDCVKTCGVNRGDQQSLQQQGSSWLVAWEAGLGGPISQTPVSISTPGDFSMRV